MVALTFGFRPFFFLGPVYGVLVVAWWVAGITGAGWPPLPDSPALWHAHEMLYGFVGAAVGGFLLTAVAAFTGRPAVSGRPLGVIVLLWLAGRVAMGLGGLVPGWLAASVDLAFPVALAATVARELVLAGNHRNLPLAGVLALLAASDALFHAARLGAVAVEPGAALLAGIHVVLVLLAIIAGRIVPSFTANWLRARGQQVVPVRRGAVEAAAIALTLATGVAHAGGAPPGVVAAAAGACAAAHALRLAGWRGLATLREPLLLVLHAGYAWLVVGYGLLAVSFLAAAVPVTAGVHALVAGAMGTMILAVMSRVALGHTGRPLHASRSVTIAYGLVGLAAAARVAAALLPAHFAVLVETSAALWVTAWTLYLAVYAPILWGPRADAAGVPAGSGA